MKTILATAIISLLTSFTFSQDINALWDDFRNGSSSRRVKACDELTRYYQSEAKDSLRVIGEELFMYGIDEHYYPAIEQGKLTLATWFILSGQTADGITMAKALLSNMEERGDDRMVSSASSTISLGYIAQKDGKSANYWAKKAGKYGQKNADPIVRAESLMVLAESYYLLNQSQKAIETYQRYITAIKPYKKYRSMSAAYARLGDIYRMENKLSLTKRFFNYSMKYARLSGASIALAHAMNNMAIVYFEEGDTAMSRNYFTQAMDLRIRINDPKAISESYYNLGDYYFYTSNYNKAFQWYQKSLDYSKSKNLLPEQGDALRALAALQKSTGDYKGAAEQLERYVELREEIEVRNSSDDEEVADLQRTILRLEAEHEVSNGEFNAKKSSSFKWEWLVIVFLGTVLVLTQITRRKTVTGN